ncbi:MAG: hypothetical protein NC299_11800 [Lachnospiraceae bacterium]|nr:hypothetical protein [Lachnospiraceae bacterium]
MFYNFNETDGTLDEISAEELIERAYEREEAQAERERGRRETGGFELMDDEELAFWAELAEEEEKADALLRDKIMRLGEES